MNLGVAAAFLIVGLAVELATIKNPSAVERIAMYFVVAFWGVVGLFIPLWGTEAAVIGFALAKVGDLLGKGIVWAVDTFRLWREERADPLKTERAKDLGTFEQYSDSGEGIEADTTVAVREYRPADLSQGN